MDILITVLGDEAGSEASSLAEWLRADEDVPKSAISLARTPTAKGEMGPVTDIVQLLLDPTTTSATLTAVAAWLTARRQTTTIHIKSGDREVEVESASIKDPAQAAKSLMEEIEG
ncbi:hypothetical protein PHK61_30805 [Actinomycetospora lutea]|uniref:effector-associated constant component EACC1 n=1 Tax=Actinomycetospora lutea TaxID=663604 RepID=UPI00236581AA|nr:hypothetical protein [Actinomycetospora lutea]MDD7942813.1 hypothetical protein [Actinomycetospora lutea]